MENKPWYKSWWGIIVILLLWPFLLSRWIWRKEWNKTVRIVLLVLLWMFISYEIGATYTLSKSYKNDNYSIRETLKSPVSLTSPSPTAYILPSEVPSPTAIIDNQILSITPVPTSIPTIEPTQIPTQKPSSVSKPTATLQPSPTPIVVSAGTLVGEFDKNKLAANDKYRGKTIQTTAYISNISGGGIGGYYLSLKPSNEPYYFGTTMQCFFADKSQLLSLSNGQSVTVQGTMADMSLGIVIIRNCNVVK